MVSLKIDEAMFKTSPGVLREAFSRSSSIPYVNQLVSEILQCLNFFSDWRLDHVEKEGNRMATLIAHSVISDQRLQSYVATCGSSWLHHLLAQESATFPPPHNLPPLLSSLLQRVLTVLPPIGGCYFLNFVDVVCCS